MKPKEGSIRREAGTASVDIVPSVKDGIFIVRKPNMYTPRQVHLGAFATIYGISEEAAQRLEDGDIDPIYDYLKEFRDFPGVYRITVAAELVYDTTGESVTIDYDTLEEYSPQSSGRDFSTLDV